LDKRVRGGDEPEPDRVPAFQGRERVRAIGGEVRLERGRLVAYEDSAGAGLVAKARERRQGVRRRVETHLAPAAPAGVRAALLERVSKSV
jgi:hypothetical protein